MEINEYNMYFFFKSLSLQNYKYNYLDSCFLSSNQFYNIQICFIIEKKNLPAM